MKTQVAIVGCGPVGALLANLLGRRGIKTAIFERQSKPYDLPRAVHIDGEAMRVIQAAGLSSQMRDQTLVGKGMLFQDFDGKTLVDWSREQKIGPMGWHESYRFHQPGGEVILRDGLKRFDYVNLFSGHAVVDLTQSETGVDLTLDNQETFNAEFVVACDGASSTIRQSLDIGTEDLGFRERWLVVDLELIRPRDDLGDYSIQFCDPIRPATYVRSIGNRRRWELRLQPEDGDAIEEAEVWRRLKRWITPADATLERVAIYTFRSCIAKQWQSDRVFLAGDAAHQMPPFMGQGLCAGIRDVANIAWKLHAVLNGADKCLLNSYGSEREHNVRQFIELSVRLGRLINQTAADQIAPGQMKSIWPRLGPGLGADDGVGGELAPQMILSDRQKADDFAEQKFYLLAGEPFECGLPVVMGQWDRLSESGFRAAIIRPDGYALAGVNNELDVDAFRPLLELV